MKRRNSGILTLRVGNITGHLAAYPLVRGLHAARRCCVRHGIEAALGSAFNPEGPCRALSEVEAPKQHARRQWLSETSSITPAPGQT